MTGMSPERLDLIRQRLDETGYAEWKHAARDLLAEVDRLHECYAREDATAHDRAEKAEAERDEAREAWDEWKESSRAGHAHATDMARLAEGWKAKHAALRAEMDTERGRWAWDGLVYRLLSDLLNRDAASTPQPDTNTVTLLREDVEALLNHGVLSPTQRADAVRRVRAALGWGDEA